MSHGKSKHSYYPSTCVFKCTLNILDFISYALQQHHKQIQIYPKNCPQLRQNLLVGSILLLLLPLLEGSFQVTKTVSFKKFGSMINLRHTFCRAYNYHVRVLLRCHNCYIIYKRQFVMLRFKASHFLWAKAIYYELNHHNPKSL